MKLRYDIWVILGKSGLGGYPKITSLWRPVRADDHFPTCPVSTASSATISRPRLFPPFSGTFAQPIGLFPSSCPFLWSPSFVTHSHRLHHSPRCYIASLLRLTSFLSHTGVAPFVGPGKRGQAPPVASRQSHRVKFRRPPILHVLYG